MANSLPSPNPPRYDRAMDSRKFGLIAAAAAQLAGVAFFGAPFVAGDALEIFPRGFWLVGICAYAAFCIFVMRSPDQRLG